MAEEKHYDPGVEANIETKGLDKGRIKNQDLARDMAELEVERAEMPPETRVNAQTPDELAHKEIFYGPKGAAHDILNPDAKAGKNFNETTEELRIKDHEVRMQEVELSKAAETIGQAHREQMEIDKESPDS